MRFLSAYKRHSELRKVPPVYYISGGDLYLKEKFLGLILEKIGVSRDSIEWSDSSVTAGEFLSKISQTSLFEPVRVFAYSDVDKTYPLSEWVSVKDFLESGRLPQGHYVVFLKSQARKNPRGKLFKYLCEEAEWAECHPLRESRGEICKWVGLCMRRRGRAFTSEVVHLIADLCKKDLFGLESELEKLSWYPGAVDISVVRRVVAGGKEGRLAPLFEMVSIRNGSKALERFREALWSMSVREVVDGLARYLHRLVSAGSLVKSGKENHEISEALGIHIKAVPELRSAVGRYSLFHLMLALQKLACIDVRIRKEGDVSPLLENLLFMLCETPEKLFVKAKDSRLSL